MNTILIIGCGNMGGAMLDGWLAGGIEPVQITVVDPFRAEVPAGVRLLRDVPGEGAFDFVLLGIKPQQLADTAPTIAKVAGPGASVLSVLAGVDLVTLRRAFPQAGNVVRVMPNLSAALGKSPIALAGTRDAAIETLMAPLGTPEWVEESLMDLMTALVGSGPAFVYRVIDALAGGAEALGLARDQADRLALAMVEGAAALAAQSPDSPGELARRVSSPGGTTVAGLSALDEHGALARLLEEVLRRARDRGAQLADSARNAG